MQQVIPPLADSALALSAGVVEPGTALAIGEAERDSLLYVAAGSGTLERDGASSELADATASLVLAGEDAMISAASPLELVLLTVAPVTDRHASLGERETTVRVDERSSEDAYGMRAYQVLFGPRNGSTRATLFTGFIPPGRSAWHYHLYDEIVWIPEGPGRLHRWGGSEEPLAAGSAFRLRPREVHIVENTSDTDELTVVGCFTPAGSPSAAYLAGDEA
jgi:quercetin dioxygenase-like cupin family protein